MDKLLILKDRIVAKIFRILTLNFIFPYTYKKAAKKPVDPNKIVFIELRMSKLSNSFKVIFDELVSKYDYDVHTHFLLSGTGRKYQYLTRCIDMLRDIATAKYVFMNEGSNCIGSIDLRKETKLTQLWHGCGAFKKFGLSTADLIFGESRKQQLAHPFNKNYSLVTISSPEVSWAYEEAMNLSEHKEVIQATGSSRTDVFYDEKFIKNAYETLYDIVPEARGKKIILYAPTFRGRVAKATTSRMFNLKMFYDNLGDDYFILFKHHPHAKKLPIVPREYASFAMDVTKLMDIEDLLCVSDICITDYSSLVFEYSLFEKPIIFFAYDLDTYFDWRGFYYDYYEMSPGPVCTTNLEMIDYIKHLDERFDKQRVKDFRYKFMRSCDGHSTERILDTVIGKDELENHKKDFAEIKPFNTVPKSDKLFRNEQEELEKMAKFKTVFRKEYEKYSATEIQKNKLIILDCSKEINMAIKKYCPDCIKLSTKKIYDDKKYISIIKEISDAEYIIIDKDNAFLDMLSLKDETNIVFIPFYSFPFRKFGKSTLEYESGIYKTKYDIAPMFKKVDIVCANNELYKDIYTESVGVESSSIAYFGDIKSDCFFDEKYKKKAMDKLLKLCPDINNKKILLQFETRENELVPVYETDSDNYLYEYLKDDYVILKHFLDNDGKKIPEIRYSVTMNSYTKGMFDITGVLSEYEAIAVADVIIGSFSEGFFSSFAAGKPVFAYTPYARRRLHGMQTNFKYDAVLPCKVYTEPEELANAVLNVKDYDFTKLNKFRETFICNSDGKSTERLLSKLDLIK